MSTNNLTVVKNLDSRYFISLGYCTKKDPDTVYDNEAEARAANGGDAPSVGFVVIDRTTGGWADFAQQAFAYCEGALQCYNEHVPAQDATLIYNLDDDLALALFHEDKGSQLCPDGYVFGFFHLQYQRTDTSAPKFLTCDEALAYYERFLRGRDEKEDEEDSEDGDGEQVITDFSGEYDFLNNGFDQEDNPIHVFGLYFRTAEGAFQSQKCPEQADRFVSYSGREAKRIGAKVPLRKDWNSIKDFVMAEVLLAKFSQDSNLERKLLNTGDAKIEPHNTKHDNYWGSCQCAECAEKKKENRLGIILMRVRENLRSCSHG